MGELSCLYCGAKAEGKTFDEADEVIDHSWKSSRPCSGDPNRLVWKGTTNVETKETPKKKVAKVTKKKGRN